MGFPDSSVSKVSACNAGDPSSIPGSGRSAGEGIAYPLQDSWASLVAQLRYQCFPDGSVGKEPACNAGDLGLIPRLGRSPGEGKDYSVQYSGLENSMDCIIHGVTKSRTRLSDFHAHTQQLMKAHVQHNQEIKIKRLKNFLKNYKNYNQ